MLGCWLVSGIDWESGGVIGDGAGSTGPAEYEAGALSGAAFDADATAVFAKNFAADGESDAGATSAF